MEFTRNLQWGTVLLSARRGLAGGVEALGLRQAMFFAACVVVLSYASYTLFLKRNGELVGSHGTKPTAVFLEGTAAIGQSFRAEADGLDSVEFRIGRMDSPLDADIQCELLRAEGGAFRPVHRWVEHVALPSSGGAHRFAFSPVRHSRGEVFRFIVRLGGLARKIPIEASMDNAFDAGAMIVGEREEWGDLVFATGAMASTSFGYFRMTATQLPAVLRPPAVQLTLLALYVWAWLCLLYWLFVARPDP